MKITPAAPTGAQGPSNANTIVGRKAPFAITSGGSLSKYLKLLVYGAPGNGKTTLLASAVDVPSMGDVLMLDAESGDMAIQDNPRVVNVDRISHVRVTGFKQVAEIHKYLLAHCRARDANDIAALRNLESNVTGVPAAEIQEPKQYRTVIIDSLTEVDQYCMYELLGIDQTKPITSPDEINIAEWGEFRKNNQMMQILVRAFRDLSMNVLFACHQQYSQDEMKKMHFTPALTGKLSGQTQGFVDICGFLVVGSSQDGKEQPRRLLVQPVNIPGVGKFDAKNRRAAFKGIFFEDPTMLTIMKGINLA